MIGIIYGAIVAAMQTDLKRVIAYSSVAHMGFVVLGIFSLTVIGLDGGVFTMLSHPLTTGALFLLVGMLYERRHTREIGDFGGVWKSAPILTALFLAAMFAGIGLPGSRASSASSCRCSARSSGPAVRHRGHHRRDPRRRSTCSGRSSARSPAKPRARTPRCSDVTSRGDRGRSAARLSLFLGFYPKPVLDRIEPSVAAAVENFERKTDYRSPEHETGAAEARKIEREAEEADEARAANEDRQR